MHTNILTQPDDKAFYATRFVFTAVKIQVEVFWVVTPCSVVVGYQCFRGPCCLHLHFTIKMEAARSSETMVSYHNTTQHPIKTTSTQI
jgi:hypothetical protein